MKRMGWILVAVALIFAMVPTVTAEDEVRLRLEGGSGNVGDLVTVSAITENAPESQAFYLLLEYDPAILEPVGVDAKVDINTEFQQVKLSYEYGGKTVVFMEMAAMALGSPLFSGNTHLVDVVFRIKAETPGYFGTRVTPIYFSSFVPFVIEIPEGQDAPPNVYPIYKGGQVCVGTDEALSTFHAIEIMRHLIGKPTKEERIDMLDWDGNGSLNIADAVLLLRELN